MKFALDNKAVYNVKAKKTTVQREMFFDDSTRNVLLSWINALPLHAKYVWGDDDFKVNALGALRWTLSTFLDQSLNASCLHAFRHTRLV